MSCRRLAFLLALWAVLALSTVGWGCRYYFTASSVTAPLGTEGDIGVRIEKTHAVCTMPDPHAYVFTSSALQILSQAAWVEVRPGLLETRLRVSLSQVGEGSLRISKTCSKEGETEVSLPVEVTAGAAGGPWDQARGGAYPYEAPSGETVLSVEGEPSLVGGVLAVGGVTFGSVAFLEILLGHLGTLRAYYVVRNAEAVPLLVVGESLFLRFDVRAAS